MLTSLINAGPFSFPEESTLSKEQRKTLQTLFIEKSALAIKSAFSEEYYPQKLVSALKKDPQIDLVKLVMVGLLDTSRKAKDLKIILNYSDKYDATPQQAEKEYQTATMADEDGLFNAIIRETLKTFKKCIVTDDVSDKTQLTEAFNVLWETVVGAWVCDFSEKFWEEIVEEYSDSQLTKILATLKDAEGSNICEKIASFLATTIKVQADNAADSCCARCCKGTCDVACYVVETVAAILPDLIKIITIIISNA